MNYLWGKRGQSLKKKTKIEPLEKKHDDEIEAIGKPAELSDLKKKKKMKIDPLEKKKHDEEVAALKKKIEAIGKDDELSDLKKKIARLEIDATSQGKTVESLTVVLYSLSDSLSNRFEFGLSDGTTNKTGENPSRVAPVQELDYDEAGGVQVSVVVCRDGNRDISTTVGCGSKMSVAQAALWWIDKEENVCKKKLLYDLPPSKGPLISFSVK